MIKFEELSDNWAEMARDIFEATKKNWSIEDYIRAIKLVEEHFGKSYLDRRNVLEWMLQNEMVRIADNRLVLGRLDQSHWFAQLLRNGSMVAWELTSDFFPSQAIRKFEAEHLEEIGLEGEKWVFECYSRLLTCSDAERMKHVSLVNDTLGFDIVTPSLENMSRIIHIEVKTTNRPVQNPRFYLSRNEFEVGLKDPNWVLVMVQKIGGEYRIFGHCFASQLEEYMPMDTSDYSVWESVKVTLVSAMVRPGLP